MKVNLEEKFEETCRKRELSQKNNELEKKCIYEEAESMVGAVMDLFSLSLYERGECCYYHIKEVQIDTKKAEILPIGEFKYRQEYIRSDLSEEEEKVFSKSIQILNVGVKSFAYCHYKEECFWEIAKKYFDVRVEYKNRERMFVLMWKQQQDVIKIRKEAAISLEETFDQTCERRKLLEEYNEEIRKEDCEIAKHMVKAIMDLFSVKLHKRNKAYNVGSLCITENKVLLFVSGDLYDCSCYNYNYNYSDVKEIMQRLERDVSDLYHKTDVCKYFLEIIEKYFDVTDKNEKEEKQFWVRWKKEKNKE